MNTRAVLTVAVAVTVAGCGGQATAPSGQPRHAQVTHATFRASVLALYAKFLPPNGIPSGDAVAAYANYGDQVSLIRAPADEEGIKRELIAACQKAATDFRNSDGSLFSNKQPDPTVVVDDAAAVQRIISNLPAQ